MNPLSALALFIIGICSAPYWLWRKIRDKIRDRRAREAQP